MDKNIENPPITVPILVLIAISVATLWIGISLFNKLGSIRKSVDSAKNLISDLENNYKIREQKIKNDLAALNNDKIQIEGVIQNLEKQKQKSISLINDKISRLETSIKNKEDSKITLMAKLQVEIFQEKKCSNDKDQLLKERDQHKEKTKISGVEITINPGPPITYDPGPKPTFNFYGTNTKVPGIDIFYLDKAMSAAANRINVGGNFNLRLAKWLAAKEACDLANLFEKAGLVDKAIQSWKAAEGVVKGVSKNIVALKLDIDKLNSEIDDQKKALHTTLKDYISQIQTKAAADDKVRKCISTLSDPNNKLKNSLEFDKEKQDLANKINSYGFAKLMLFIIDIPAFASALSLWTLATIRLFLAGDWFGPRIIIDEKK